MHADDLWRVCGFEELEELDRIVREGNDECIEQQPDSGRDWKSKNRKAKRVENTGKDAKRHQHYGRYIPRYIHTNKKG